MSFISLGLDPGSSRPGLALVDRSSLREWAILRLPVLHSLDELAEELATIHHLGIQVDVCCVEDVAWSLHAKDPEIRRGGGSGLIIDAVGQVRLFAAIRRIPFLTVTAAQWRKVVTGTSRATKEQVRDVLQRRVCGWPRAKVSLNSSDAVAIAMCGGMTKAQLELLGAQRAAKKGRKR